MRALLLALTAALLLAGCGSPALSEHRAKVLCMALTMGGNFQSGLTLAQQDGITDPADAAAAVRNAVRDHCPQYTATVGG